MQVTGESRRTARWIVLSALMVLVLGLAACGGDDDDTGAAATSPPAQSASGEGSGAAEGGGVTGVPTVDELTGDASLESQPPTTGPAAAKGKSIWWVSCGMSLPACSTPANAAKEAAAKLGVKFQIADGKLNQGGGYLAAVRTALATDPDLIIIHGISCSGVRQPLQEAKKRNVTVMGVEALDCDDEGGGPNLFTADMKYAPKAETAAEYFTAWGKVTAEYLIAATGGKTKYIYNRFEEPIGQMIDKGFKKEIAGCSGCEKLQEITFLSSDGVPNSPWTQRLRPVLLRHPDADAVIYPVDAIVTGANGAKIAQETIPSIKGYGGSGESATLDLVRNGTFTAATGAHDAEWMGWAAIDNANRVLNGEDTVPQGVGFRPVDKEHNLPAQSGEGYHSPIDFKGAYGKLWGGKGG